MTRLTIAVLLASVIGSASAADESKVEPLAPAVPIVEQPVAASAPMAASAPVAAPAPAPAATQNEAAAPTTAPVGPRSGIPLSLRRGADATKCLELGPDKEIAACAEKYR